MSSLDASFRASGSAVNLASGSDVVQIVFTSPPAEASGVRVELIEAKATGDAQSADRVLATFRGTISKGKFQLDGPSGDPLDTDPKDNPELNAALKKEMSGNPPKLKVRFDASSTPSDVPLPDVGAERLVFEIKLRITGTVAGKAEKFEGSAVLQARPGVDVMIVPDMTGVTKRTGEFAIFDQNSRFAAQWKKAAAARREVVTIKIDGSLAEFESAVGQAAGIAKGGDVLLSVGHGGAGGFRGLTLTSFDSVPSSVHGMNNHPNAIHSDVLNLEDRAKRISPGKWVPKSATPSSKDQAEIDDLARRFEALERVGVALKAGGVRRFVVMACNMGKDPNFGAKLSKLLQTKVGGYDKLLMMADTVFTGPSETKVQAWLIAGDAPPAGVDPDRPPAGDREHSSYKEIPQPVRNFGGP